MQIGLQTFTIRKLMRTPQALDAAFGQVAALGIQNLELAVGYIPFPFTVATARMIRGAADRHGLRVTSCQIKYETAAADVPATLAYMRELGAQILVNSVIDLKLLNRGEAGLLRYCGMLDTLKEKLAAGGVELAHHNHHYEFLRMGNQNVLAFMAAHSRVGFALDTYWTQRGGGSVPALLEELEGRVPVLHLRDFTITRRGLITGGTDCACGQGNIPFGAVLRAAEAAGVRWGMIEQKTKTPLESAGVSADYFNLNGR